MRLSFRSMIHTGLIWKGYQGKWWSRYIFTAQPKWGGRYNLSCISKGSSSSSTRLVNRLFMVIQSTGNPTL